MDCMVSLPGQLFYNTMIPVCLWFISRDRKNNKFRNRRGEILFIDARNLGAMIDRRHRELTDADIARITGAYHAWRAKNGKYRDEPGFCKSAKQEEVQKHGHILNPGRYVGAAAVEEDPKSLKKDEAPHRRTFRPVQKVSRTGERNKSNQKAWV